MFWKSKTKTTTTSKHPGSMPAPWNVGTSGYGTEESELLRPVGEEKEKKMQDVGPVDAPVAKPALPPKPKVEKEKPETTLYKLILNSLKTEPRKWREDFEHGYSYIKHTGNGTLIHYNGDSYATVWMGHCNFTYDQQKTLNAAIRQVMQENAKRKAELALQNAIAKFSKGTKPSSR